MSQVEQDWYVLCWCAKWLGQKKMHKSLLPEFKDLYAENPTDDSLVMRKLWDLLDAADIVVAHNAVKFDIKRANTRFLHHGMCPPSPYRVVDTLKIARRHFAFMSNKLDDLGKGLGLGQKKKHAGIKMWADCLAGSEKAWKMMVAYCEQDVRLLQRVYTKLAPYADGMPNLGVYVDRPVCPRCGSKKMVRRGFVFKGLSRFRQYRCSACGSWSRSRKREDEGRALSGA